MRRFGARNLRMIDPSKEARVRTEAVNVTKIDQLTSPTQLVRAGHRDLTIMDFRGDFKTARVANHLMLYLIDFMMLCNDS